MSDLITGGNSYSRVRLIKIIEERANGVWEEGDGYSMCFDCPAHAYNDPPEYRTLRVRLETAAPIYMGTCGCTPTMIDAMVRQLADGNGKPPPPAESPP